MILLKVKLFIAWKLETKQIFFFFDQGKKSVLKLEKMFFVDHFISEIFSDILRHPKYLTHLSFKTAKTIKL